MRMTIRKKTRKDGQIEAETNQLFTGLNKNLLGLTNWVFTAYMTIDAVLLTPSF
jgi:hypothetical protein